MLTTGNLSGDEIPERPKIGNNNSIQKTNRILLDFIKKFEKKKKKKKKKINYEN